jgi:hypothetical protein
MNFGKMMAFGRGPAIKLKIGEIWYDAVYSNYLMVVFNVPQDIYKKYKYSVPKQSHEFEFDTGINHGKLTDCFLINDYVNNLLLVSYDSCITNKESKYEYIGVTNQDYERLYKK